MLIDTHAHLYAEEFKEDRDQMIQRAISSGVKKILLPNIDQESIPGMLALCTDYPGICYPMMGLHPCSVDASFEKILEHMESYFQLGNMIAVGETGIDLYWDKTFIIQQRESFRIQIEWAKKYKLPIVIHARDSFDEIFTILDELNDEHLTGVFHCFTGNFEQAKKVEEYKGFKLGIGGVITFKNSGLDKTLSTIDLKNLILETDSPYLAPVPFRGKRNESEYITKVVTRLAEVYSVSEAEIIRSTGVTANSLFHLKD